MNKVAKVGDRVEIIRKDIFPLKHRKNRNGIVTARSGAYITVRPMWCKWECELYPGELNVL